MTFDALLKDLSGKNYRPVYLLTGDEPYFIDIIANYIAGNVLGPAEQTF
ncbi:MAG: hypothetical protein HC894_29855 [Microcoleus sp. SM1_3_4]|nr:hypothetical protein [Microcoleus sp. SM1_3_4]